MKTKFMTLNWKEVLGGLLYAVVGGAIFQLVNIVNAMTSLAVDQIDWTVIVKAGIAAGLTYILQHFFTNSKGQFLRGEK